MTEWLYETLFVDDSRWWVGGVLIYLGIAAFLWLFMSRYGSVVMGPDPVLPKPDVPTLVIPSVPAEPNWVPLGEAYVTEFVGYIDATAAAVIDLTDTVVIHPFVDPLADTVELERVDEETPLFYSIKRPAPLRLESYTDTISRASIERAKAAKEMAA